MRAVRGMTNEQRKSAAEGKKMVPVPISTAPVLSPKTSRTDTGTEILSPTVASDEIFPEERAGLVARSHTLLSELLQDPVSLPRTQVVHINDLLHLMPRSGPPEFSSGVSEMRDHVGLLYFDAELNTLCFSMPWQEVILNLGDPTNEYLVWVPLELDFEAGSAVYVDTDTDGSPFLGDPSSMPASDRMLYAGSGCWVDASGTTKYLYFDSLGTAFGSTDAITVAWRWKGYGLDRRGESEWSSAQLSLEGYSGGKVPISGDTDRIWDDITGGAAKGRDGTTLSEHYSEFGMEVEIVFIHPVSGEVLGTTFWTG